MIKYILLALILVAPAHANIGKSNMMVIQHQSSGAVTIHHRIKELSKFQEDSIMAIGGIHFAQFAAYNVILHKGAAFAWDEINPRVIEIINFDCENCHKVSK